MPCSVVVGYQHFRGPCCFHLQGHLTYLLTYLLTYPLTHPPTHSMVHYMASHFTLQSFNNDNHMKSEQIQILTHIWHYLTLRHHHHESLRTNTKVMYATSSFYRHYKTCHKMWLTSAFNPTSAGVGAVIIFCCGVYNGGYAGGPSEQVTNLWLIFVKCSTCKSNSHSSPSMHILWI